MSKQVLFWLALATVISTLCCRLGYLPLLAPDEGRNATVAREMNEAGAWLVPTYNGAVYLDKPAFFFKTVALSLAAFGNNEAAARVPSAAAAVALTLMVFGFCRNVYGTRCALIAVLVVSTTPLFVAYARTVIFDMMLCFFVCGAIFAGYLAELKDGPTRRNWYLVGAACAGLGTLVKGPIGFLIPLLVLLAFNRLDARTGAWKRLLSPLNFLVFLAVTIPWFVSLCRRHPDFLQYGLIEESFKRFTSAKRFHRSEPFYFYALILAIMFVPWNFLLPEAAWATWKRRWPKHPADRLCLVWAVLVVVFFSLSQSKLPAYILSVSVAYGILVARLFDAAWSAPDGWAAGLVRRATAAVGWICLVAIPIAALVMASQTSAIAKALRLSAEEATRLLQSTVPLMTTMAVFSVLGVVACYRRSVALCFVCLAFSAQACGHASMATFSVLFEAKSARRLAEALAFLPAKTELACVECFPTGLPFYLGRKVILISNDCDELTSNYILYRAENLGKWPETVVPLSQLSLWLKQRKDPVCLITTTERRWELTPIAQAAGAKIEALSPGYVAVRLHPREDR